MSKNLSAVALALSVIAAPASALADVGLETGTAGYSLVSGGGSFTAASSYSYSFDAVNYNFDATGTVIPAVGTAFGVLTTVDADPDVQAPTVLSYTFAAPTATASDVLYFRLVTPDADAANGFDDSLTIELFGPTGTAYYSNTFTASFLNTYTGFVPDSGWLTVQVAAGTTGFKLSLTNVGDSNNDPTAFVDYLATPVSAPVPEPLSSGLALAGLGVMGLIARRRNRA
jgi:hypothetical protein